MSIRKLIKLENRRKPIELENEKLNEVLSAPPFWLVRSGNTLFFFTIVLILGLSYLIKYPVEVSGKVTLLREKVPVEIQNQTDGKLSCLSVRDGQWVEKGTFLASFKRKDQKEIYWKAPVEGRVLCEGHLTVSNFYRAKELRIVVDPQKGKYVGYIRIPGSRLTKVKKGQPVFIELSNYPKNEFGILEGKVKSVASLPKNETYEVGIELPQQLNTNYKCRIPRKAFLEGKATVITGNKRLFEYFFEDIVKLF